ncbi:hypothetical protein IMZ48_31145 [Candidatus Bathyarchaeota archaeon]|nr:hypothetical protein [Candidatus Bathyarchaeota archaeon]
MDALEKAQVTYVRDISAFDKGVLRLRLTAKVSGETVELIATYPDLYPYFRIEVVAPYLSLHHHQNPFGKNLCLLGRSTDQWKTTDTLASLLSDRLATAIKAGRSNDRAEVVDIEQQQAEPFTDYFTYLPGTSVVMSGGLDITNVYTSGTLELGLETAGTPHLRAAVLRVRDEQGNELAQAERCIQEAYCAKMVLVRWVRLDNPPLTDKWSNIFDVLQKADPHPDKIGTIPVNNARMQVRAAVFPQETRWRQSGQGWLFACKLLPPESLPVQEMRKKREQRTRGKRGR